MSAPRLLLAFRVGEIRFGLPAESVVEVVRATAVGALPGAPAVVEGLINYRGTIVPVFDAARRFTERERQVRASHAFVVADTPNRRVALHVDQVDGLIESGEPSEPPVTLRPEISVAGVVRTDDGVLILQDLSRFLSHAESWSLEQALRATSNSANANA